MITLTLTEEQAQILKLLLVQVIANQVNTNPQAIVTNAQNSIYFMGLLENRSTVEVEDKSTT